MSFIKKRGANKLAKQATTVALAFGVMGMTAGCDMRSSNSYTESKNSYSDVLGSISEELSESESALVSDSLDSESFDSGSLDSESLDSESLDSESAVVVEPTWDTVTEGTFLTRPKVETESVKELLSDLNFSKGFAVTLFHANSSNGQKSGYLDYEGMKAEGTPVWTMAQWGCTKDMVADSTYTRDGGAIAYTDGGKYLKADLNKTGCITLGINGSVEYTLDEEGNIRERTDSLENWPHILIEQSIESDISSNCKRLYMELNYKVTKCESLVDRELYPVDVNLNAAQFQWFITLTDTNEESESYGQAMWFGFSMFDTRAEGDTPVGNSSYDGGKEDSTGLFIYMPSLKSVATSSTSSVDLPTSVVGKDVHVKFDILPFLKQALKIARQNGALKGATVDHLRIGSTNIGWELPGNYDAEVEISYLNMYEEF
jgi:hypothetical protein